MVFLENDFHGKTFSFIIKYSMKQGYPKIIETLFSRKNTFLYHKVFSETNAPLDYINLLLE